MPPITTTLFTGSLLVVVLCQAFARQASFPLAVPTVNLLLSVGLLFCLAGLLTSWLETQPRQKPDEDEDPPDKKNPHDTTL